MRTYQIRVQFGQRDEYLSEFSPHREGLRTEQGDEDLSEFSPGREKVREVLMH